MSTSNAGSASSLSWRAGRSASSPGFAAPVRLELTEVNFDAMGCQCQVLALGGPSGLAAAGELRVRELERQWTRFSADSELSRFNGRAGSWTAISPELSVLLWRGIAGLRLSDGLFNPFMGAQIREAGYDRDFAELDSAGLDRTAEATPAMATNDADAPKLLPRTPLQFANHRRLARIAPGLEFDSGGIGKGLGAQLVVEDLLRAGAKGAMVSLGGDVAVGGMWPDEGWRIGIEDPTGRNDQPMNVVLREGSICTSGTLKRRWRAESGNLANHILDPATGKSLTGSDVVAASAIARQGWRAEIYTKMAVVGGTQIARKVVRRNEGVALLVWDRDGTVSTIQ